MAIIFPFVLARFFFPLLELLYYIDPKTPQGSLNKMQKKGERGGIRRRMNFFMHLL